MTPKPRRTALIVDDDPAITELLSDALREEGIIPLAVRQGQDAIDALDVCRFDLLVADLNLPDMDGLHICKTVHNRDASTAIIVITGETRRRVKQAATTLDSCKADVFTKPFDLDAFLTRIDARLHRALAAAA